MADFIAGFDPAGQRSFGWCVCEDTNNLPLQVVNAGVVSSPQEANVEVDAICNSSGQLKAIGIDAPLFWDPQGNRQVDQHLRQVISSNGGSPSTVMAVNSLPGACLIQGMMIAMLYRATQGSLPITEAHLKAMLYAMGLNPTLTTLSNAQARQQALFHLPNGITNNAHTRDAALSSLAAWVMLHSPRPGWTDFYPQFGNGTMTPLSPPMHYYFPD